MPGYRVDAAARPHTVPSGGVVTSTSTPRVEFETLTGTAGEPSGPGAHAIVHTNPHPNARNDPPSNVEMALQAHQQRNVDPYNPDDVFGPPSTSKSFDHNHAKGAAHRASCPAGPSTAEGIQGWCSDDDADSTSHDSPANGRISNATLQRVRDAYQDVLQLAKDVRAETGLSTGQVFDQWFTTYAGSGTRSKGNMWNLYNAYFKSHASEELDRISLACVISPAEDRQKPSHRELCYAAFKADNGEKAQEILMTFQGIQQVTESKKQTVAQRTRAFRQYSARVTSLMDSFETHHGFSGAVILVGNSVNSDGHLAAVHMTKHAEGFFEDKCRAPDDVLIGHMKSHVYNRVSNAMIDFTWEGEPEAGVSTPAKGKQRASDKHMEAASQHRPNEASRGVPSSESTKPAVSSPIKAEKENQAESLLKVEACGRATRTKDAEGRRCGKAIATRFAEASQYSQTQENAGRNATQTQTQIEMLNVGEQEPELSGRFASVFTREMRANAFASGALRPGVDAALGERAKAWHGSPRSRIAGNSCLRSRRSSQVFAVAARGRARTKESSRGRIGPRTLDCVLARAGECAEVANACAQDAKTTGSDLRVASAAQSEDDEDLLIVRKDKPKYICQKFRKLLGHIGVTVNGSLFPWKTLAQLLAGNGAWMENWPEDVPWPGEPAGEQTKSRRPTKGITTLKSAEINSLLASLKAPVHRIRFRKCQNDREKLDLVRGVLPVIYGAPPPSTSIHKRGRRLFANGKTDREGHPRLEPTDSDTEQPGAARSSQAEPRPRSNSLDASPQPTSPAHPQLRPRERRAVRVGISTTPKKAKVREPDANQEVINLADIDTDTGTDTDDDFCPTSQDAAKKAKSKRKAPSDWDPSSDGERPRTPPTAAAKGKMRARQARVHTESGPVPPARVPSSTIDARGGPQDDMPAGPTLSSSSSMPHVDGRPSKRPHLEAIATSRPTTDDSPQVTDKRSPQLQLLL
ncbi:hypothetical protein FKP32DRAFT_1606170 [Trametes sanguinea]|nr:hypothetical protein FKP32DRAFT_1606170 [Trametes sanguinea]